MSRLHRSLAADLFISLHQICQCHMCLFWAAQICFPSRDCFSEAGIEDGVNLINKSASFFFFAFIRCQVKRN